eukprot:14421-Prymnesium_polylepis.1
MQLSSMKLMTGSAHSGPLRKPMIESNSHVSSSALVILLLAACASSAQRSRSGWPIFFLPADSLPWKSAERPLRDVECQRSIQVADGRCCRQR